MPVKRPVEVEAAQRVLDRSAIHPSDVLVDVSNADISVHVQSIISHSIRRSKPFTVRNKKKLAQTDNAFTAHSGSEDSDDVVSTSSSSPTDVCSEVGGDSDAENNPPVDDCMDSAALSDDGDGDASQLSGRVVFGFAHRKRCSKSMRQVLLQKRLASPLPQSPHFIAEIPSTPKRSSRTALHARTPDSAAPSDTADVTPMSRQSKRFTKEEPVLSDTNVTPRSHKRVRELVRQTPTRSSRTPKSLQATELSSPQHRQAKESPCTPRSPDPATPLSRYSLRNRSPTTPLSRYSLRNRSPTDTPTTRAVRRRNVLGNVMNRLNDDASESDLDPYVDFNRTPKSGKGKSLAVVSEESEFESDSSVGPSAKRQKDIFQTIDLRVDVDDNEQQEVGLKGYFDRIVGAKLQKTSNNTLSKSDLPQMTIKRYHDLLKTLKPKHKREKECLLDFHRNHFNTWMLQLDAQFNLLFYGIGSKRLLLEEFADVMLKDRHHVVINGFDPSLPLRDVFAAIMDKILCYSGRAGAGLTGMASTIHRLYAESDPDTQPPLFLVVHNLDGPNLRNEKAQQALAILANSPRIHLVASIDHIQSLFLLSPVTFDQFNFLFQDLTTYEPCTLEASFNTKANVVASFVSDFTASTGTISKTAVLAVLHSLTGNAKGVFRVLAEHQLQRIEESNSATMDGEDEQTESTLSTTKNRSKSLQLESIGLDYMAFYERCRESFLTTCDANFRHQLTEFRDHLIIQTKVGQDGEMFYIPLDATDLNEVLDQL